MLCVLGNLAHPESSSASRRRCGGLELDRVANCGNEVIEALSPSIVADLGVNEAVLRRRSQYKTSGERDLHSMVVAVGGQRQLRQIWKGSGSFHVGSFLSLRTRQNACGTRSCPQTVSSSPSSTLKALKKCVSHLSSCLFSLPSQSRRCAVSHSRLVPRSDGSRVRETTTTMRRSLPYPARLSRMASAYSFCLHLACTEIGTGSPPR